MKVGDKLVCVSNEFSNYKLKIGEVYTVAMISVSKTGKHIDYIILNEDPYRHGEYQFIPIKKHVRLNRKEKLQKICSTSEIE